jgi:FG-GAP repeat
MTRTSVLVWFAIPMALATAQHVQWIQTNPDAFVTATGFPGCCFIAVIADLNGDGIPDILAHDPGASIAGINHAGRIAVFSGSDGSLFRIQQGTTKNESLGLCGGPISDVDSDGVADYLTHSNAQGIRIVSGATGAFGPPIAVSWGWWCVGLGDVNGDGTADFAVSDGGCVTAISGATSQTLWTLCVYVPGNVFGVKMDTVSDVDGDGKRDLVIGAPTPSSPQISTQVGRAYLVSGATGALLHMWSPMSGNQNQFGRSVCGLDDVNGDGSPDVLIGAPGQGQAFVYSCAPPYGLVYSLAGVPPNNYTYFGLLSASIGDLDGDGWPDYALMVESGGIVVKSGPTGATLYPLPLPPTYFGTLQGIGRGGDLDADGFEDLLVGYLPWPPPPPQPWPYTFARISTIPMGISPFGAGCPQSTGTTARIGATRPASSAQTFGLTLSQLPAGRPVGLIVGLSASQYLTASLPWDLTSVGVPGCSLLASIDFFLTQVASPVSGGTGSAVQIFTIPIGLSGSTYYAQWAIENPPGSGSLGSLTRGLSVTIQ